MKTTGTPADKYDQMKESNIVEVQMQNQINTSKNLKFPHLVHSHFQ